MRLGAPAASGSPPPSRQVPGLVRVLVLWHPLDRKMTVMHLAESREALTGVSQGRHHDTAAAR